METGILESAGPVPLADALARWRREAHFGVCDTGRYRPRYFAWGRRQLPLFAALQRKADGPAFEHVPAEVWDFQRANTAPTPLRAFARRALMVAENDLRPLLPAIRHPVLLIAGDRDAVVSRASADELAA